MSIAGDAKSFAEAAVEQGKQAFGQAQSLAERAYTDLRAKGDSFVEGARRGEIKGLDSDAINAVRARVAPLVSQAIVVGAVTEKAGEKADELRHDPRFARAISGAEMLANTVHERVVQPVLSHVGISTTPAATAAKKPTGTVPAQTKPAAPKAAAARPSARPSARSSEPTLHAVKPTKASARAPRKTTADKPDSTA